MTSRRDFLVELGTEELPPKALKRLSQAFGASIAQQLAEAELNYQDLLLFATPRRLAVKINGLVEVQADTAIERRGPPVKIAFDDNGKLTKAGQNFAQTCGISADQVATTKTDKGEWLFFSGTQAGKHTNTLLPGIVQQALSNLPIPKRMRWGDSDIEFVRPVHWAVMLWGNEVLKCELIGMPCGRQTRGHRFLAPAEITLNNPAEYPGKLTEEGWVIADFAERRQLVVDMVEGAAKQCGGAIVADDELFDEITALVEWPVPVAGEYDARFLQLPPEVLISTLKDHQRYFPVVSNELDDSSNSDKAEILPWFITVSNIKSKVPEEVKLGNQRVVTPRLADAEFFWESDKKKTLADRVPDLEAVVFQQRLGSLADKVARIDIGAVAICDELGGDKEIVQRAVSLAKCDLLTGMVGEFPDLQGIMGQYYAIYDNEPAEVATAMAEQYLPRFANDKLPATKTGQALALADRLDTLTSIFGLGKKPTGTKDPFGLRRAALGVIRIIIESKLPLNLTELVARSADAVIAKVNDVKKPAYKDADALARAVLAYMHERMRGYFVDSPDSGIDSSMFDAVSANSSELPLDFKHRIDAVREFMKLSESSSLIAANKRIANIIKSAKADIPKQVDAKVLVEDFELELYKQVDGVSKKIEPLKNKAEYQQILSILATLKDPVDAFFDNVMVMDDDLKLRANRLALLTSIRRLFLHTADFSKVQQ